MVKIRSPVSSICIVRPSRVESRVELFFSDNFCVPFPAFIGVENMPVKGFGPI